MSRWIRPLLLFVLVGLALGGCAAQERPVVAIVQGEDANAMVAQAIELIGGLKGIVKDGDKVVIKPNLTYYKDKIVPGTTTDVRVAAGVVAALKRSAHCQITFAESSGGSTMAMYKAYGYDQLAQEQGIALLELKDEPRVHVQQAGMALPSYDFPKPVKEADVFIDMPVLKTHQLCGISVGMKNLYGLLDSSRTGMHEQADDLLSDLAAIKPPGLIVVDGLSGMEGQGPIEGTSVKMNLVIVGTNIVAVDAVAAAVMGFEPTKIRHLQAAKAHGLGECDLSKIEVRGAPIAKVAVRFKPPVAFPYTCAKTRRYDARLASVVAKEREYEKQVLGAEPPPLGQRFASEILKLDPVKYPLLCSRPFTVDFSEGSLWRPKEDMSFALTCDAFERPLVVAEINRWLLDTAEVQIAPHPVAPPRPTTRPARPASQPTTAASTRPASAPATMPH